MARRKSDFTTKSSNASDLLSWLVGLPRDIRMRRTWRQRWSFISLYDIIEWGDLWNLCCFFNYTKTV
ncbi:MAG: hypothetical protein ACLVHD_02690 [Clostridium sp.]